MLTDQAPLWDEAIEGLLTETQQRLDSALTLDMLQEMAINNAVRVGDIIETLYLMAIYGDWQYLEENGQQKQLDEEALQAMYARGRIDKTNIEAFNGVWIPTGFFPREQS